MCDQLATIGVEFEKEAMKAVFKKDLRYAAAHPFPHVPSGSSVPKPFASSSTFPAADAGRKRDVKDCDWKDHHPDGTPEELWATARPWALGQTRYPTSWLQKVMGIADRRPGLFMRVDPETNEDTDEPLLNTNERVHSSVRVRLACGGLGLDDKEVWECKALTKDDRGKPLWKLERDVVGTFSKLGTADSSSAAAHDDAYTLQKGDDQWIWTYSGNVKNESASDMAVPQSSTLLEEPLVGYWERLLLSMTRGQVDVWRFAEKAR